MLKAKKLQNKVQELILHHWPIHPSGVCRILKIEGSVANISKIKYHFNVLEKREVIITKKIDRALVAWPKDLETARQGTQTLKEA